MSEENLCVLIDFENIAAGVDRENLGRFNIKLVMDRLKEKGRVLMARAYGDWGRFAKYKQSMLEQGVCMAELTSYRGQDKNRADIALVVDAMELLFMREHIHTFVLLSGDSDFTPLVMKLREMDKKIIGMGTRKSTSRLLSEACDEFIFYDNLLKRAPKEVEEDTDNSPTAKTLSKQEAIALLVSTLEGRERSSASLVKSGSVKQFMLRKAPTFDEGDYGFSGFTQFLEYAQTKGLIHLIENEKGGGYHVATHLPTTTTKTDAEASELLPTEEFKTEEANKWTDVLNAKGFHPVTHYIRHTVVHEFVDHILDRRARKKRSTLIFTYGDISRRCRKTDPAVPTKQVKQILNTLHASGELFGQDNKPIRSKKASFTIHKDAEDLLQVLRIFYVKQLLEAGEELTRIDAVSELLWGDLKHEVEATQLLESIPKIEVTQPVSQSGEFVEGNEGDKLPVENEKSEENPELGLDDVLSDLESVDSEATK
jgi:uncharacterized protein (TIGR00288 family)